MSGVTFHCGVKVRCKELNSSWNRPQIPTVLIWWILFWVFTNCMNWIFSIKIEYNTYPKTEGTTFSSAATKLFSAKTIPPLSSSSSRLIFLKFFFVFGVSDSSFSKTISESEDDSSFSEMMEQKKTRLVKTSFKIQWGSKYRTFKLWNHSNTLKVQVWKIDH